jgi:hypothetical protein
MQLGEWRGKAAFRPMADAVLQTFHQLHSVYARAGKGIIYRFLEGLDDFEED